MRSNQASSRPPPPQPQQQIAPEQQQPEKINVSSATINMVKGFVGLGILSLPYGFMKGGWLGGLILFILCGSTITYMSLQLIAVANKKNSKARSIIEFSIENLGEKSEIWSEVFQVGFQFGVCTAYVIFFSTYFQQSLCFFTDNNSANFLCGSRVPSLLISLILVLPSIFIRNMAKLKDWCLFANGLIIICLGVIFLAFLVRLSSSKVERAETVSWSSMAEAVGIFIFAFEGITLYFEIRSSMEEPHEFSTVLKYSLGGGMVVYSLIGLVGYLAFGSSVKEVVLFNFSMENPLFVFIQILYCIGILLSYPLQMYPVVSVIELKLIERLKNKEYREISQNENEENKKKKNDEKDKNQQKDKQDVSQSQKDQQNVPNQNAGEISNSNNQNNNSIMSVLDMLEQDEENEQLNSLGEEAKKEFKQQSIVLRIGLLLGIFLIAIVFKSLSVVLNLVGSVGGVFFGFILPVVVYEKAMPEAPEKIIYFHRAIMVLGIIFSIAGIVSTLKATLS